MSDQHLESGDNAIDQKRDSAEIMNDGRSTGASRQEEVGKALNGDQSQLGEVYRFGTERNVNTIAAEEGCPKATIYAYRRYIAALSGENNDFPDKPSIARGAAGAFRRLLKGGHRFSEEVRGALVADLERLNAIAADDEKDAEETAAAIEKTQEAEEFCDPAGAIYVYSYPHYLRYPVQQDGRTLLKVGKTLREVGVRIAEQARQAGLPEDPVLLRIYSDSMTNRPVAELEALFHSLLIAADHERARGKMAGKEWFLTSVKFTDAVAAALKLEAKEVSSLAGS